MDRPGGLSYTDFGTTNGARYARVNSLFASGSPMHVIVFGSKLIVRPTRYEIFARCTSTVDAAPSSTSAVRSCRFRDRTALKKFTKWLPPLVMVGPGSASRPMKNE